MRLLWAILGMLLIGGGAVAYMGSSGEGDGGRAATPRVEVAAAPERDQRGPLMRPDLVAVPREREAATLELDAESTAGTRPGRVEPAEQASRESNTGEAIKTVPPATAPVGGGERVDSEAAPTEPMDDAARQAEAAATDAPTDLAVEPTPDQQTEPAPEVISRSDNEAGSDPGDAESESSDPVAETETSDGAVSAESERAGEPAAPSTTPVEQEGAVGDAGESAGGWSAIAKEANEAKEESPPAAAPAISVERREDGRIIIDGRYAVTGSGTPEDPFVLPWDLLVSVERVYNPREGQRDLPAWLKLFDDKSVKITGFLLLPVMADEVTELLLMRNAWDGCCIGVPPTAYDAIEVKLATESRMSSLDVTYGDIVGTFDVDPYLSGNWLIGLYLIEEAEVLPGGSNESFGP